MFLTHVLFKKAKSKFVMVMMQSVVSGHTFNAIRERLVDKLELIRFDPFKVHSVQNNRYNQLLKKLQSSSAEASPLAYEQFRQKVFTRKRRRSEV